MQEIVDSQELSPVDVDRMNAERDQLNKNLESFSEKIEDINKIIWEREIHCQKKGDEVLLNIECISPSLTVLTCLNRLKNLRMNLITRRIDWI